MSDKKPQTLKPCPSALDTHHKPYLAFWDDQHETLITPTAQVKCTCGFSGPERYGDSCRAEAIVAWNTRPQDSVKAVASVESFGAEEIVKIMSENLRVKKIGPDWDIVNIREVAQALSAHLSRPVKAPSVFGMDVKVDPKLKDNEFRIEPGKTPSGDAELVEALQKFEDDNPYFGSYEVGHLVDYANEAHALIKSLLKKHGRA